MAKSLLISVRFFEGRYHGEEDRFQGAEGWPPSPARLFQALVAGAARGNEVPSADQQALRWLEQLGPPRIVAPPARRGSNVKLFVPNNDLDAKGGDPSRLPETRVGKTWRPCFFDAEEAVVYAWDFDAGSPEAARICGIADRLCQLGRGIDPAWATADIVECDHAAAILDAHPGALREPNGTGAVPSPRMGTLDSLVQRHRQPPIRQASQGRRIYTEFEQRPKPLFRHVGYDTPPRRLYFELRSENRFAPLPLRLAAALVTSLRDGAASKLQETLPNETARIEKFVVGRGAGPRDLPQRIRIVPIPSIGHEQVAPAIRRVMVEVPVECPIRSDDLRWAFLGLQPCDLETGALWNGRLVSTDDSQMAERFMIPSHRFRSLTPPALPNVQRRRARDDGLKGTGTARLEDEKRAADAVLAALRHAGVRSRPHDVKVQREPFQRRGTPARAFAEGSRFSESMLWHVEATFPDTLEGPLIIGNGRFCGLGLMVPVEEDKSDLFVFHLDANSRVSVSDRFSLIRSLRRALMSVASDDGRVPKIFSGHEQGGKPARGGSHEHVFLAADDADHDGYVDRLLIAAPWACDRTARTARGDRGHFNRVPRMLTQVKAGKLGVLALDRASPLTRGDPLVGPAYVWETSTPYRPTRHAGGGKAIEDAVVRDVVTECGRRGLPEPDVEVLEVNAGPRGGNLIAHLRLRFAVALKGPVLLGRDSHAGGGLFAAK